MGDDSLETQREALRQLLEKEGLPPEVAERVLTYTRPTLELVTEAAELGDAPAGSSRIGGRPDLPAGSEWPVHGGEPMFFLGQLNLAELEAPEDGLLPGKGVLSFFFTASFDHTQELDCGKVLYFEDPSQLVERLDAPARDDGNFEACRIVPRRRLTVPDWTSPFFSLLDLSAEQSDILSNTLYDAGHLVAESYGGGHRLLGLARNGQSDATFTAAQTLLEDGEDRSDEAVEIKARVWRLLFQCVEDEEAGMSWVDSGSVCFVMREEDLKARRFDRVFTDLQFD